MVGRSVQSALEGHALESGSDETPGRPETLRELLRKTNENWMDEEDDEEERACRFCFCGEEEGELISPCNCKGGQKWIHVECLRRWQRSVLVTQPTHPAFYSHDTRQDICNVCKGRFDPPAPPRAVLMAGFTGNELAALLEEGR